MKIFKDMDTEQYWLTLWSFAMVTFTIFTVTIAVSAYTEDTMVTELVKAGYDPIELACLYNLSDSLESSCMILSQAKSKVNANAVK